MRLTKLVMLFVLTLSALPATLEAGGRCPNGNCWKQWQARPWVKFVRHPFRVQK